jgi:hypothetical protein
MKTDHLAILIGLVAQSAIAAVLSMAGGSDLYTGTVLFCVMMLIGIVCQGLAHTAFADRHLRTLGVLASLVVLFSAGNADACNRCGLFGNKCRFAAKTYYQPTYYAPAVYTPPDNVQNFIFNNSYPTPLLGNSVYGYSLASQAYSVDPAQVLDRSSRLAELAFTSGQKAIDDFNETAGNALALSADASRRSQNTLLALSAIQANEQPATSLSFRASVTNGKLNLERIEAAPSSQPATAPAECQDCKTRDDGRLSLSMPAHLSVSAVCGRCHDGTGKNNSPKGLTIDDMAARDATDEQLELWAQKIWAGEMPPKSKLTTSQRISVTARLERQQ